MLRNFQNTPGTYPLTPNQPKNWRDSLLIWEFWDAWGYVGVFFEWCYRVSLMSTIGQLIFNWEAVLGGSSRDLDTCSIYHGDRFRPLRIPLWHPLPNGWTYFMALIRSPRIQVQGWSSKWGTSYLFIRGIIPQKTWSGVHGRHFWCFYHGDLRGPGPPHPTPNATLQKSNAALLGLIKGWWHGG